VKDFERALNRIALCVHKDPDSYSGIQLRQFLWSLSQTDTLVNLRCLVERADASCRRSIALVINAALAGALTRADIQRALCVAGEFKRRQHVEISEETVAQVDDLVRKIGFLARIIPPSPSHEKLAHLSAEAGEVKRVMALESEKQPCSNDGDTSDDCPI
jgi:hypothetical protein